jgi:hypothetical protein
MAGEGVLKLKNSVHMHGGKERPQLPRWFRVDRIRSAGTDGRNHRMHSPGKRTRHSQEGACYGLASHSSRRTTNSWSEVPLLGTITIDGTCGLKVMALLVKC